MRNRILPFRAPRRETDNDPEPTDAEYEAEVECGHRAIMFGHALLRRAELMRLRMLRGEGPAA